MITVFPAKCLLFEMLFHTVIYNLIYNLCILIQQVINHFLCSTEKPGVPQQPVVSGVTRDSCIVTWKAPTSDGGAKIKAYYLEKREKKQNKWIAVTTEEIHDTHYEVKGLIEGFEYEFRVKCENMGGESDWSEISEPVVPKSEQKPRAPFFKEELRDMNVKYKAHATFVTKVVGHPKPVIKWYKGGKEILPDGKKIKVQEFKGGYYQLVISDADENDATTYQIRATNQEGSISTTVNLDVESKTEKILLYSILLFVHALIQFDVTCLN